MHNVEQGTIPEWTVADRLRKAREHAGMKQIELAEEIGVSRNSISNYESSVVAPRRIVINAWSAATKVPVSWLMTGDDEATPAQP